MKDTSPLGIFGSLVLQRKDLSVVPGDRFFLYSDGMVEPTPGSPRRDGISRLAKECAAQAGAALSEADGPDVDAFVCAGVEGLLSFVTAYNNCLLSLMAMPAGPILLGHFLPRLNSRKFQRLMLL